MTRAYLELVLIWILLPAEHKSLSFRSFPNAQTTCRNGHHSHFFVLGLSSITFILWQREPISEFLVIAAEKFPPNYGSRSGHRAHR